MTVVSSSKRWLYAAVTAGVLAFPASALAQATGQITGVVTSEAGTPLAGASVGVAGTDRGAQSGADGRFTITAVPAGLQTVRATFAGYAEATRQVTVVAGQTATVDIPLRAQIFELEGVVAVGYGTQRREALTGAVGSVTPEQLRERPVARVTEALQGSTPGLTVIQRSAQPGRQNIQFDIRGRGSLANTTPLVLIDGVPGDINQMNPNDIESISVLKDAASAAIYGSRAANGVVLVTTRRGSQIGGLRMSYDGYYGIQGVSNFPKAMGPEGYLGLINEAAVNAGFTPRYTQEEIAQYVKTYNNAPDADPIRFPWTDWLGTLFNPAPIHEHTLAISGGADIGRFNLSLNYLDHQGMSPQTWADRVGMRLNTDFNVNSRLTAGADFALRKTSDAEPHAQGDVLFRMFHDTPPTTMARYPDGTYGWSRNNHNPLAYAEAYGRRDRENLYGSVNTRVDYRLFESFTIRTQGSAQLLNENYKDWRNQATFFDFFDPTQVRKVIDLNRLDQRKGTAQEYYFRALGEYDQGFGDHRITTFLGYDQTQRDFNEIRATRENFYANQLQEINAGDASRDSNFGTSNAWRLRSVFGRASYNYAGKYMLEANGRYDGSSRFAQGNRYGFFPSVSAAWRLSEEPFFRNNVAFVDEFKFRGSWGKMGNQDIGLYRYFPTIAFGHTYVFGNTLSTGAAQTQLANEDISWETTTMTNLGLDFSVLNGRLSFVGDVYEKYTDGILLSLPIPNIVGMGPPIQNAAEVRNRGYELGVNWQDFVGDVRYSVSLNFWDNVNRIVSLAGTGPYFQGVFIQAEGGALGDIYGFQALGLFRDEADVANSPSQAALSPLFGPGDIKFADLNGDGVITLDDRTVIGNDLPRYSFGSNLTAGWRGFDVGLFFQGVLQANFYREGALTEGPVWENFTIEEWNDRWTVDNPNPNAKYPKPSLNQHHNHGRVSSFWVGNGAYGKLKTAQLGYQLPLGFTERFRANSARIYVSGQNLITWSEAALLDPEAPSGRGTVYPQTRTVSVGTSIVF